MNYRAEHRPPALGPGRYLERLSKALPGKGWSRATRDFWPDNAKLVISISLQFAGGGQLDSGISGPFPPGETGYPDAGLICWHEYASKEGIPRLLDIFERRHARVTADMSAAAVDRNPQLVREIVERGHEASARVASGVVRSMEDERKALEGAIDSIRRATGARPLGLSGCAVRGTSNTLQLLPELGFVYSAEDVSRDEPFVVMIGAKPLVAIPCAPGMDDLAAYGSRFFSSDQYAGELKNEFEMLYSEGETRRRLMSIRVHGCISGRPARAKALEEFIIYAQRRPGVVFLRKDEIARFALASAGTPREEALRIGREAA